MQKTPLKLRGSTALDLKTSLPTATSLGGSVTPVLPSRSRNKGLPSASKTQNLTKESVTKGSSECLMGQIRYSLQIPLEKRTISKVKSSFNNLDSVGGGSQSSRINTKAVVPRFGAKKQSTLYLAGSVVGKTRDSSNPTPLRSTKA